MNLPKTGSILKRLLIIIPVAVGLAFLILFMPAQQLTIEGIGMLSFETTITLSVGYEVAYASPDYYGTVSALSPTYWWRLDGDETDYYGNADSDGGTDPSWTASIIPAISGTNQCGDYNGSSSETLIPNKSDINSGDTNLKSISVWIECDTIDTSGGGRAIWAEGYTTNNLVLYTYNDSGTNKIYWKVMETSGTYVDYISYGPISTGTVYHVGATLDTDAGEMRLYLNGSEVASKTGGLDIGDPFASHQAGCGIGLDYDVTNHNEDSLTGLHDGRIADLAYWAEVSVLDGDDFTSIYNEGVGGCSEDITNSLSSWSVNGGSPVATSSSYSTGLSYFTVTNNSGGAVDISISGTDMTGGGYTWTLSDTATPGDMTYGLKAGLDGGDYTIIVKKTAPYNDLVTGLADSGTQDWGLKLWTPTSYDDENSKTGTVTITATCQ